MTYAQRGDRPCSQAEQDRVMLRVWTAYRCFTLGAAGREEWADVADALNIDEALCAIEKLDAATVMPLVTKAQAGMVAAMRCAPGPMVMAADELEALRQVCDRYDVALHRFSVSTLNLARSHYLGQLVKQAISPDRSAMVVMA